MMASYDIEYDWKNNARWKGTKRDHTIEDVIRLRGTRPELYVAAEDGATKFWNAIQKGQVAALGALTGNQAIQMVDAGLKAIYVSGWQVAADNNLAGQMYPDQSLYPCNSVPALVRSINNALRRADQIQWAENYNKKDDGKSLTDYFVPIVADAEAGFGGTLNAFEITKALIEAGAAAIHFEDQLASEKKCGHMGGKVLVSIQQHIRTLKAARLAADIMGVPTVIIARTDALDARLTNSTAESVKYLNRYFTGERDANGLHHHSGCLQAAIDRSLCYAPYADMLWCETHEPDLAEAKTFAQAIHEKFPGKSLAYNCSPSFNWKSKLCESDIEGFLEELEGYGYNFVFITLAGFHANNKAVFDLARDFRQRGMSAYADFQEDENQLEGYRATKHQRFVGTGYFDEVVKVISGNDSTSALKGSTEEKQF